MALALQVLKLCAGIGLFLFAMYLLEDALKNLSGRKFKQFLQRVTRHSLAYSHRLTKWIKQAFNASPQTGPFQLCHWYRQCG